MENSSELGSVISLRSSGFDDHNTPSNGTASRRRQPGRHKASGYQSKGLPYQSKSKTTPLKKKTGREMWVTSVQNGGGMSAEGLSKSSRNGSVRLATSQGSGSKFLMDQLMQVTGRQEKDSVGYAEKRSSKAAPNYKSPEEYYDEVLELKKVINALKEERELSKKKTIRLEEELQKQSKTITELLDPNMQTNEMRRAVTSKSKDSAAVISSLQHKVFSVERLLKEKESELSKVKSDLKYTDVNEARIEAEVYRQELKRLASEASNARGLSLANKRLNIEALRDHPKQFHEALKLLADDNARLVNENRSLKRDLIKAVEPKDSSSSINKDYEDMNRAEMLAKIAELEKHLKAAEKLPFGDGKASASPSSKRKGSREDELTTEIDKLKETIVKLKEDRTHYRSISDEYRTEIDRLNTALATSKNQSDSVGDVNAGSKPILKKQTSRKSSSSSVNLRKLSQSGDDKMADNLSGNESDHDEDQRSRKRSVRKKSIDQHSNDNTDESIALVQATLRGHISRQQYIQQQNDSPYQRRGSDLDQDLVLVQAALRGHAARRSIMNRPMSGQVSSYADSRSGGSHERAGYSSRDSIQRSEDRNYRNRQTRTPSPEDRYERGLIRGSHSRQDSRQARVSVDNLQKSSRPWSSKDIDESDETDTGHNRDNRWRDSGEFNGRRESRDNNQRRGSSRVKERWEDSKPARKKSDARSSQIIGDGTSGDDDDDDLVVGSSSSLRSKKKPSLLDELF